MSDSNAREGLNARHERNRERRIEGVKRWVEYIKSEPPETWGPQQNAIVDDQLDSAQAVQTSVSHQQRVADVAAEILEGSDDGSSDESDDGSK